MKPPLEQQKTPEERELDEKRAELAKLEEELAQRELELATLRGELEAFEHHYRRVVGVKYAELDEIEAELAELLAARRRDDASLRQRASAARAKAGASREAVGDEEARIPEQFSPSKDLKSLFHQVAMAVHPDFGTGEEDRELRTRLMAEALDAYRRGDEQRLRDILGEWETRPESVRGEGVGADWVRVVRQIARIRQRLEKIRAEIEELAASELNQLRGRVKKGRDEGEDLLASLSKKVEARIAEARRRLEDEKALALASPT